MLANDRLKNIKTELNYNSDIYLIIYDLIQNKNNYYLKITKQ